MKRRSMLFAVSAFLALIAASPYAASASCLAISKDSTYVDCRAVIAPPFMLGRVYVVAALFGDAATGGVTGAEFRIEGFPAAWFPGATPNAAATSIGDPLGNGCAITFADCQTSPTYTVLLYTISYFPTDAGIHNVNVVAANPPGNPQFDCPVMKLCDETRSSLCVSGGYFRFNNVEPCEVGVEQLRWSEVKALFQ